MLFDKIILFCFRNIKTERTASSIYHLLKGRKSIQTVQDAYLYKIDPYYGIYPTLSKKRFDHKIMELQNKQLLQKTSEGYYEVTIMTIQMLKESQKDLEGFHGIEFQQMVNPFKERLFLLIQTLTNTYRQNYNFIPVTDKWVAENFVRKAYQKYRGNLEQVLIQFHDELHRLLWMIDRKEAAIFVDRLSGYKNYGASIDQLSQRYNSSHDDIELLLSKVILYLLLSVSNNEKEYPILFSLMRDLQSNHPPLSSSANKTYELLNQGYQIEDIVRIRNLKINTIHDHIVEIAIRNPYFPIYQFIEQDKVNLIIKAMKESNTYRLRDIKQNVDPTISYFDIRLTLALTEEQRRKRPFSNV